MCRFRMVGPCHMRTRSVPPLPRPLVAAAGAAVAAGALAVVGALAAMVVGALVGRLAGGAAVGVTDAAGPQALSSEMSAPPPRPTPARESSVLRVSSIELHAWWQLGPPESKAMCPRIGAADSSCVPKRS